MRRPLLALLPAVLLACAGKTPSMQASSPPAAPTSAADGDETMTAFDLAQTGRPNLWKYTRRGPDGKDVVVRRERDLNGVGRVDVWEYYDDAGNLEKQVVDLDFDGKADVIMYFEKGQMVRKEMAFGFDGKPREIAYYEKGKLARKEKDENGDGRIDYWEYWENGEIDRIGIDTDGDGKVDRWEVRRPAPAASPSATPAARASPPTPAK